MHASEEILSAIFINIFNNSDPCSTQLNKKSILQQHLSSFHNSQVALDQMQAMEQEMRDAEVELKRRKAAEEEKAERERNKTVIATPGRAPQTPAHKNKGDEGKTPATARRTPKQFGL